MVNRVFVFGGTGSGKTTLAKELSEILDVSYYTTDNIVYKKVGVEKYSEKEKCENLKKIARRSKWIIEGVHSDDWLLPAFKKVELVVILDIKKYVLFKRIIKRSWQKRKSKNQDNLRDTIKLLYWSYIYKKDDYINHKKKIAEYNKKFIILRNDKEIKDFFSKLKTKSFI